MAAGAPGANFNLLRGSAVRVRASSFLSSPMPYDGTTPVPKSLSCVSFVPRSPASRTTSPQPTPRSAARPARFGGDRSRTARFARAGSRRDAAVCSTRAPSAGAFAEIWNDASLRDAIAAKFELERTSVPRLQRPARTTRSEIGLAEPGRAEEPAGRRVRGSSHFSASALNTYAECARKWFYKYACAAVEDPARRHRPTAARSI